LIAAILIASATSLAGDCGDVNNSGTVNILDVSYLINYLYKSGPPPDCGTVTDIDGNIYRTIKIGAQVWMAENLKVTHYRNGDPISYVPDAGTWFGLTGGAYCEYNDDLNNSTIYGKLYNWQAVADARDIAPAGWHIPTDAEWKVLEIYLGMSQTDADGINWRGTDEGGKLKESGGQHWEDPNLGATNESGFAALPGGFRLNAGNFADLHHSGIFWTDTEYDIATAWFRYVSTDYSQINRSANMKGYGYSVRCVKD
jgi:uncharacterized protein (TIGR02145 family)